MSLLSFLLVVTMSNRVSFSPVKEVLTFSPMDAVAKLGKSKKRSVSVSTSTDEPVGEGVPLIGDGPTEGSQTFMKKVKELQNRLKKIRKRFTKKNARKGPKGKKLRVKKKGIKTRRKGKAREGLFLSKRTTLNSLISRLNFAKVPLTQLLSK